MNLPYTITRLGRVQRGSSFYCIKSARETDIVLCKSISRFARNTVDLLSTVRHLRDIGVEVRFEKENVNSMTEEGELMLTLLAVFSQEESVSISENSKWGIRKRFQEGTVGTANKHILGYRFDERQNKYVIIPEEAEIVRSIFSMYVDGLSLQTICDKLNSAGHRTTMGSLFQESSLNVLIHNEIYAGDIRRQKTFMDSPLTKVKVINRGQLPQFYYEDAHEAIIGRDAYEKVKAEMARRNAMLNPTYCFTGKITCGCCGMPFSRNTRTSKGRRYIQWVCRAKKEAGMHCGSVNFNEDTLKAICAQVLGIPAFREEDFIARVASITVEENGNLLFTMVGGGTREWENLHLSRYRHTTTVTDAFQDKVFCAACGKPYHRVKCADKWIYWYCIGKKRTGTDHDPAHHAPKFRRVIWQCNHKFSKGDIGKDVGGDCCERYDRDTGKSSGKKCSTPHLREEQIETAFLAAVNEVLSGRKKAIAAFEAAKITVFDTTTLEIEVASLETEMQVLSEKMQTLIRENATVALDQEEYQKKFQAMSERFEQAKAKKIETEKQIVDKKARLGEVEEYMRLLKKQDGGVEEFNPELWCGLLDFLTVGEKMVFRFRDGTEVEG